MGLNLSSPTGNKVPPTISQDLHELWTSPAETLALAYHPRLGANSPLAKFFSHPDFEPKIVGEINRFLPDWKTLLKLAITDLQADSPNALSDAICAQPETLEAQDVACLLEILRNLLLHELSGKYDAEVTLPPKFRDRLRKQVAGILWGSGIKDSRFDAKFMEDLRRFYVENKKLSNPRIRAALEEFFEEIAFALPNETSSIRRMFTNLGVIYTESFPSAGLTKDQVYQLAFTAVMINAELHRLGPAGKIQPRTKEQFIQTLQESQLPQDLIGQIYDDIQKNPLEALSAPMIGTNE
jgi:hypothetical protein